MEAAVKSLQIVRLALLASIFFYVGISIRLPSSATPNPTVFYAIALLTIMDLAALFVVRRVFVLASEQVLAAHPEDDKALARWRTGYLVTYSLGEAVALYGLVLHFLGFTFAQVSPFYLVGFVLLLFFSPRRPANEIG